MEKKPVNVDSNELVLEMEKMLEFTDPLVEWPRWSKASIYRVPQWLKTEDAELAYRPRWVSLGPFHHDEPGLRPMEEHKRRAVLHIAKRSTKPLRDFFAAIEEVADELMDAYHDLDGKWREEERSRFVQMMVVDGCFLLEIMKGLAVKKAPSDYSPNDPVFSAQGMLSLWLVIRSDMLMIENQIPLRALYKLEAVWCGDRESLEKDINGMVLDFICNPLKEGKLEEGIDGSFFHPLDIFHKSFCGLLDDPTQQEFVQPESIMPAAVGLREAGIHLKSKPESTMPAAVELRDAGIHFRKSKTESVNDIKFKKGVLSLPALSIHDGTKQVFLNLMAFERLHSGSGTIATDYMIFMDNIINSERDVALLRSKGIIKNLLSSDKDAAKFYNILGRGAVLNPVSRLQEVRRQVNDHCKNPWNKSKAFFRHAYLKNPWVFISLMTAVILLIATLLQTVYTVLGFYNSNN